MADNDRLPEQTTKGFANAFTSRMRGSHPDSRLGPKVWAVAVAVVVVAAVAIGLGVMGKPHLPTPKPAALTAPSHPGSSTTAAGPGSSVGAGSGQSATGPWAGDGSGAVGGSGQSATGPWAGGGSGGAGTVGQSQGGGAGSSGSSGWAAGGGQAAAPAVRPASPPKPAVTHSTPRLVYSAITGYGCQENSNLQFVQHGFYANGKQGWTRETGGGWGTQGCDGQFDAMPMSGSATNDDSDNWATWQFRTGVSGPLTCTVGIWVPNDSDSQHVGGNPSTYLVYPGWDQSGSAHTFAVNQTANRNKWVTTTVTTSSGALSVKLLSRGIDYNSSGPDYAHHAVAQVNVSCDQG